MGAGLNYQNSVPHEDSLTLKVPGKCFEAGTQDKARESPYDDGEIVDRPAGHNVNCKTDGETDQKAANRGAYRVSVNGVSGCGLAADQNGQKGFANPKTCPKHPAQSPTHERLRFI